MGWLLRNLEISRGVFTALIDDIKADTLTVSEVIQPRALDSADVNEHILATALC
jgi:hypothetical protein